MESIWWFWKAQVCAVWSCHRASQSSLFLCYKLQPVWSSEWFPASMLRGAHRLVTALLENSADKRSISLTPCSSAASRTKLRAHSPRTASGTWGWFWTWDLTRPQLEPVLGWVAAGFLLKPQNSRTCPRSPHCFLHWLQERILAFWISPLAQGI